MSELKTLYHVSDIEGKYESAHQEPFIWLTDTAETKYLGGLDARVIKTVFTIQVSLPRDQQFPESIAKNPRELDNMVRFRNDAYYSDGAHVPANVRWGKIQSPLDENETWYFADISLIRTQQIVLADYFKGNAR